MILMFKIKIFKSKDVKFRYKHFGVNKTIFNYSKEHNYCGRHLIRGLSDWSVLRINYFYRCSLHSYHFSIKKSNGNELFLNSQSS